MQAAVHCAPSTISVKGFNKKYRNLFYDSGLEAVLAKAEHVCGVVHRAGFSLGRLARACCGAKTNKERLNLQNVADKSRKPRRGRRGYATKEPFAVSTIFAVLQKGK